jgi:hypothetical protein
VSCSNINGYLRNYQDCLTLGCPVGWFEIFGECFYFDASEVTAFEAHELCMAMDGQLAQPPDHDSEVVVADWSYMVFEESVEFWIGINDILNEGRYGRYIYIFFFL